MPLPAAILQPASQFAAQLATKAAEAAVAVDVLTAQSVTQLAEAEERAARRALKAKATDLALQLTVDKLQQLQPGEGNLDTLVRTATALDPDSQQGSPTAIQVAVVFRQEGRQG